MAWLTRPRESLSFVSQSQCTHGTLPDVLSFTVLATLPRLDRLQSPPGTGTAIRLVGPPSTLRPCNVRHPREIRSDHAGEHAVQARDRHISDPRCLSTVVDAQRDESAK